jgi:hypothetical protein
MCLDAPYFIILLCLTPYYFTLSNTRQFYLSGGECSAQWVKDSAGSGSNKKAAD